MAKRGFQGRKFSEQCSGCGTKWLPDMSNKVYRRAVCYECLQLEYQKRNEEEKKKSRARGEVTLVQKKKPYTFQNRKPFWQDLARQLKVMKKREEWLAFIRLQMDRILNDKQLMDYINDTETANYGRD
jgi:hypothetical protein